MHTGCGGERNGIVEPGHPHSQRGAVLGAGLHPGVSSTSCGVAVTVTKSVTVGVPDAGALITPGARQARIAEHR